MAPSRAAPGGLIAALTAIRLVRDVGDLRGVGVATALLTLAGSVGLALLFSRSAAHDALAPHSTGFHQYSGRIL